MQNSVPLQRGESLTMHTIVYDGECPFCTRYVALLRLRDAVGSVQLLNARDGGPVVDALRRRGIDLDEGMVLMMDGQVYHGAECIHRLALLTTSSNTFNRINAWVFRSQTTSAFLYPVLRAGRNAVLRLLGRRKIGSTPSRRDEV
jgi:predicted DCC family thiol-disulfide oxidoreductase YuxK